MADYYHTILLYYKVADATSAVVNVDDYGGSARLLAATTLRYTANKDLDPNGLELLSK